MKVMFDLDPKSLKKLEQLANSKQVSIGQLAGDLIFRTLNREPSQTGAGASSSGLHATGPVLQAPAPAAGIDDSALIMLLEPLIARFRLCDPDGTHRKSVIAEIQMLLPDTTAAKVILLLRRSLE